MEKLSDEVILELAGKHAAMLQTGEVLFTDSEVIDFARAILSQEAQGREIINKSIIDEFKDFYFVEEELTYFIKRIECLCDATNRDPCLYLNIPDPESAASELSEDEILRDALNAFGYDGGLQTINAQDLVRLVNYSLIRYQDKVAESAASAVPALIEWLRNNYQDYPNIGNLCEAALEAAPTLPASKSDENVLLRAVYEAARRVLRFNGIDKERTVKAVDELDAAIEAVKMFDGGLVDGDANHE